MSAQTAVAVLYYECFGRRFLVQEGRISGTRADIGTRRARRAKQADGAHRRSESQDWIVRSGFSAIEASMSSPSWIMPVRGEQRSAFFCAPCLPQILQPAKNSERALRWPREDVCGALQVWQVRHRDPGKALAIVSGHLRRPVNDFLYTVLQPSFFSLCQRNCTALSSDRTTFC